ncbi:MAG: hypothetical protein L0Z53_13365 [Acidobacteriales bacterium]|nr:hypothetical protein [Terriglobales bacterium]
MSAKKQIIHVPDASSQEQAEEADSGKPTVLEIIRNIKNQSISAKNLLATDRQSCVEHLTGEGLSLVEIAEVLKMSERTVARDRKSIQEANALEQRPELVPQMVGRLVCEAELAITQIRRAARDKGAQPAVRIDAQHRCYQITSDVIQRLQHLGYLPLAIHRFEGALNHQIDDLPNYGELQVELKRLRVVAGKDNAMLAKLGELDQAVARAYVAESVAQLGGAVGKGKPKNATPN